MLRDISFPSDLSYASDGQRKPLEFYLSCLKNSTQLDLRLGYFSSNAIRVLSLGFAQFIYKGGVARIITNHYLSEKDKYLLENSVLEDPETYSYINSIIDNDVAELEKILSKGEQHFFNCLKYLLNNKKLVLQPVKIKPNRLSHYKEGIFSDGVDDVYFNGSCNFTFSGLVENGESLEVKRSWGSPEEKMKIKNEKTRIEQILSGTDSAHDYLTVEEIESVINRIGLSKDLEELVKDEVEIQKTILELDYSLGEIFEHEINEFKIWIKHELSIPIFPHKKPHEYQVKAYESWSKNDYSGIFAMATGTGKTITSLNCLLEEYYRNPQKVYRALILVPTITLVEQWEEEALKFNFKEVIKISSRSDWKPRLKAKLTSSKRNPTSFIAICTYATFSKDSFQKYIKNLPEDTIFIADEAHNMGSDSVLEKLPNIRSKKRIGLSATPKRIYDPDGTSLMEEFFNDTEPYIVSYSMEKAISNRVLTQYDYYPHIVRLTSEELKDYISLTKQIARQFFIEPSLKKNTRLEKLLLQRKRIIHKASNKLPKTIEILRDRFKAEGNLNYTFIYVPEGMNYEINETNTENNEETRIIDEYIKGVGMIDKSILVNRVVGGMKDRKIILDQFSRGDIQVLTSMKCLDEGVDIPRAEYAIFCSSTGNPRQFIQRRGRILRKHDDKTSATVHDLVVVPLLGSENRDEFEVEKNLIKGELKRVMYFASLAKNPLHSFQVFSDTCAHYDIDIYSIFNDLKDD